MTKEAKFKRRLLLAVDAVGYGARDDQRQHALQANLLHLLDLAAARAGLHRDAWAKQPQGDGELAVLPADESEREQMIIDGFVRELNNALIAHNRDLRDEARLRLRLAIHFGSVAEAENGYSGQGVVMVSRLADSTSVKKALELTHASNLAVILSERVFNESVLQRHTSLDPNLFRTVEVRNKELCETAYLYLPGHDVHAVPLPPENSAAPDAGRGSDPRVKEMKEAPRPTTVETTIHGNVNIPNGVIGMVWNR
ncbi:hypothetical protein GV794_19570 [Nocardia cyriacigeorgica]|uniref:Guanylate cyclase domain-containing protein n=1 Tax=Nocardia cyriacigeorgica TaxID=135487 RepID=A0A6P1D2I1_9NOCA|nr:hypothetical protein [Nocardia cyriacigeorgica]NEW41409.1 hypothetical protein [Nocardia cyriacigeorgica]NEW44746.1 hypothetical protein [Nocardia cyriacigeorgica]NEW50852.1 hypothetical protein [Nocardia cyriacigeorgica]NEW57838.1 hypothetical protein [Nocardia cyriacigeorgica]